METITINEENQQLINSDDIEFLPNPNLSFTDKKVNLYANLYKISLKKSYTIYEYSVKFQHDEKELSTGFKRKIIQKVSNEIAKLYGMYFFTGTALFGSKEIKEVTNVLSIFKNFQYSMLIYPTTQTIELSDNLEELVKTKPEVKQILELMFKDVLRANPAIKFMKNLYGKKFDEKSITSGYNSLSIFPGFSTKIMFLENGVYLNVDIKNKILSYTHCLDILKTLIKVPSKISRIEEERINKYFKDRYVETIHTGQRFKVEMVNFDRKPKNTSQTFEGNSVFLGKLYKKLYDVDIDLEQPLFLIKSKSKDPNINRKYVPPELCKLVGISDNMTKDRDLMGELAGVTKLTPTEKISSINDIMSLMNEKTAILKVNKENNEKITLRSSFQKKEDY